MADKRTTEVPLAQSGDNTADGITAVRKFNVEAPSGLDALAYLYADKGVRRLAPYTNAYGQTPDPDVKCRSLPYRALSPTPVGGVGLWEITARYSSIDPRDGGAAGRLEPPTDGSKIYAWSRSEINSPIDRDVNGNVITNSKGEPYDPRLTILESIRTVRISWIETNPNLTLYFRYDNAVNTDEFTIQGRYNVVPGQCRHHGVDPAEMDDGRFRMDAYLEFRPGGKLWEPYEVPDYTVVDGKRQWLDGAGNVVPKQDEEPPVIKSYDTNFNPQALAPLGY